MKEYDVIIIGAGVIGSSIARELSRYKLEVLILEKENDVSCGASKANSGIVHGGYDAKNGTLKGYFSHKGNRMFEQLNRELNFGYLECGSMVLGFSEEDLFILEQLMENGKKNGVNDLRILETQEILSLEPYANPKVKYGLYCKSAGVTSPYEMTIALCENAISNGVELKLNSEVIGLSKDVSKFIVKTTNNVYNGRYIINAAGLYSDKIPQMLGMKEFTIFPRKGEYILLNKSQGYLSKGVIFQTPTKDGKGILVTRTLHGNLMLGPDSTVVDKKDDVGTTLEGLSYIVKKARISVADFDMKYTLTSFAGLRATSSKNDFIIEESQVKGFINVAGIESPGLTSSPAIALYVTKILNEAGLELEFDERFNPYRKSNIVVKGPDFKGEIDHLQPELNIICRCENVTEKEIVDALHREIPINHIDGIKRRTRGTMGGCQGHFCTTRIAKIIAREMGIEVSNVTLRGPHSVSLPPREDRIFWKKLEE